MGEARDAVAIAAACRAMACSFGVGLVAAGCGPSVYPIGVLTLTGPSGAVSHLVGDNHTYALPHRDLAPPSLDPPGTPHTLGFQHPAAQRQEVIAFDLHWSEPIVHGPQPAIDYLPVVNNYVSVTSGATRTYAFDLAPTAHVVRYWHGVCAAATPWKEVFDPISERLLNGLAQGAAASGASSISRLYDVFQPYFIGAYATIEHGFSFEAYYDIHGGPLSFLYSINPAYELHIRPEDGLVEIESVHQGVVPSSPAIQQALQAQIPAAVAQTINDRLTFSLENPVLDTSCDPGATLTEQQEFCYSKAVAGPPPPGYLYEMFRAGFEGAGLDPIVAVWAAEQMLAGLEPKNFTCVVDPELGSSCALHLVIQRINVLPDELEFVFVAEDDPFEKVFFHQNLPTVMAGLAPDARVPQLCWGPIGRPDGAVSTIMHGYEYVDL